MSNSKEIATIATELVTCLKTRFPSIQLKVDLYNWVTTIVTHTEDYIYLDQLEVRQDNYEGDYRVGYFIGEKLETIIHCTQKTPVENVVNVVLEWYTGRLKQRINKFSRLNESLENIVGGGE